MSRVMFDIVCTDERLSRDLDQVKSQDLEGKRGIQSHQVWTGLGMVLTTYGIYGDYTNCNQFLTYYVENKNNAALFEDSTINWRQ